MVLGIRYLRDSGSGSAFCCVSKVCIVFKEGIKEGTKWSAVGVADNPHRREGDGGHKCSPAVRSAPDKRERKTR